MERNWKSYLIELFIVIFGVSIAFWLSQISQDRREEVVRKNYLEDIRLDLQNDIKLLDRVIIFNTKKQEETYEAVSLFPDADNNKDAILEQAQELGNYNFFNPKDFTYQSMIASGDFKLIADAEIKRDLIRLHSTYKGIDNIQINFIQALDDSYFPYVISNWDYTTLQPTDPDFHRSLIVKNFFMYTVNELGTHVAYYKYAKKSASKLDSLIQVKLQ